MHLIKFGTPEEGDLFSYPDIFEIEKNTGQDRLVIAPAKDHIELMIELSSLWEGNSWLLYVMVVSGHEQFKEGRYQIPEPIEYSRAKSILRNYKALFEHDGRAHIWLASVGDDNSLVYDQHNVIYAYGELDRYISIIRGKGFEERQVRFPDPHSHYYHEENDIYVEKLMGECDWLYFPLQDGDEY